MGEGGSGSLGVAQAFSFVAVCCRDPAPRAGPGPPSRPESRVWSSGPRQARRTSGPIAVLERGLGVDGGRVGRGGGGASSRGQKSRGGSPGLGPQARFRRWRRQPLTIAAARDHLQTSCSGHFGRRRGHMPRPIAFCRAFSSSSFGLSHPLCTKVRSQRMLNRNQEMRAGQRAMGGYLSSWTHGSFSRVFADLNVPTQLANMGS